MLSANLMSKTIKGSFKFWLGVTIPLCILLALLIFAANFAINNPTESTNISTVSMEVLIPYYSLFALLLPIIYIAVTANKLIAAQVDRGSMANILSRPVKRSQVSLTQALCLIVSIIAMFALITITGIIMISATSLEVEIGVFLLLNLGIACVHLAIGGIAFFASCIFNYSSPALVVGAGLPIIFFLFDMLSGFSSQVKIMQLFKYLTIFSLYNISDIVAYSSNMIWQFLILFGIAVGCYIAGVLYFNKKDLPL